MLLFLLKGLHKSIWGYIKFLNKDKHYELWFTTGFESISDTDTKPIFTQLLYDLHHADKSKELHIFISSFGGSGDTLVAIMAQIDSKYERKAEKIKHVSLRHWIIIGLIMLVAMLFYGIQTVSLNSTVLVIPFYLCFAGIVCVYCALFVGSNLDFFVKLFNTKPNGSVA